MKKVNGKFSCLSEPNGARKTTTLSKTSGSVTTAGYDIEKEAKLVREKVGIIFQQPSLAPQLSAAENIRFHACLHGRYGYRHTFKLIPKEYRDRVVELAQIVGIEDALFEPIKRLSGGMQRKLEIIRTMLPFWCS